MNNYSHSCHCYHLFDDPICCCTLPYYNYCCSPSYQNCHSCCNHCHCQGTLHCHCEHHSTRTCHCCRPCRHRVVQYEQKTDYDATNKNTGGENSEDCQCEGECKFEAYYVEPQKNGEDNCYKLSFSKSAVKKEAKNDEEISKDTEVTSNNQSQIEAQSSSQRAKETQQTPSVANSITNKSENVASSEKDKSDQKPSNTKSTASQVEPNPVGKSASTSIKGSNPSTRCNVYSEKCENTDITSEYFKSLKSEVGAIGVDPNPSIRQKPDVTGSYQQQPQQQQQQSRSGYGLTDNVSRRPSISVPPVTMVENVYEAQNLRGMPLGISENYLQQVVATAYNNNDTGTFKYNTTKWKDSSQNCFPLKKAGDYNRTSGDKNYLSKSFSTPQDVPGFSQNNGHQIDQNFPAPTSTNFSPQDTSCNYVDSKQYRRSVSPQGLPVNFQDTRHSAVPYVNSSPQNCSRNPPRCNHTNRSQYGRRTPRDNNNVNKNCCGKEQHKICHKCGARSPHRRRETTTDSAITDSQLSEELPTTKACRGDKRLVGKTPNHNSRRKRKPVKSCSRESVVSVTLSDKKVGPVTQLKKNQGVGNIPLCKRGRSHTKYYVIYASSVQEAVNKFRQIRFGNVNEDYTVLNENNDAYWCSEDENADFYHPSGFKHKCSKKKPKYVVCVKSTSRTHMIAENHEIKADSKDNVDGVKKFVFEFVVKNAE